MGKVKGGVFMRREKKFRHHLKRSAKLSRWAVLGLATVAVGGLNVSLAKAEEVSQPTVSSTSTTTDSAPVAAPVEGVSTTVADNGAVPSSGAETTVTETSPVETETVVTNVEKEVTLQTNAEVINHFNNEIDQATWSKVDPATSANEAVVSVEVDRNNTNFTVNAHKTSESDDPLFSNFVTTENKETPYTYSYLDGSSSTSEYGVTQTGGSGEGSFVAVGEEHVNRDYYSAKNTSGTALIKSTILTTNPLAPNLQIEEVASLTTSGNIIHRTTFTNKSDLTYAKQQYYVLLDTMLNANDDINLYSDGSGGAYFSDRETFLSTRMLSDGTSYALNWRNRGSVLGQQVKGANLPADRRMTSSVDSAIRYLTPAVSLTPNQSISLWYLESIYTPEEVEAIIASGGSLNTISQKFNEVVIKEIPKETPSQDQPAVEEGVAQTPTPERPLVREDLVLEEKGHTEPQQVTSLTSLKKSEKKVQTLGSPSQSTNLVASNKEKQLPKTGEDQSSALGALGLALLSVLGFGQLRRKNH